jgi:hypothetical protein
MRFEHFGRKTNLQRSNVGLFPAFSLGLVEELLEGIHDPVRYLQGRAASEVSSSPLRTESNFRHLLGV